MAGTNPLTTTVRVDARRPFAALELSDNKKFTGKNHPAGTSSSLAKTILLGL